MFQLANIRETKSSNKSAIQFFDAVLQQPAQSRNIEALFGKVILYCKCHLFYSYLRNSRKFLMYHLLFSQAKYYELCGHLDKANEIYSMLVVAFTNSSAAGNLTFTPPLVEKMKIELAIQDWEQADDTANRVSTVSLFSKSC